jgi:hypothetical protein
MRPVDGFITKKAWIERKRRSVTGRKSQVQIPCAWLCRNVAQL